jgi:hypothetical protein
MAFGAFNGDMVDAGISTLNKHFEAGWTSDYIDDARHEAEALVREAGRHMASHPGANEAGLVGLIDAAGTLVWASAGKLHLYLARGGTVMQVNHEEGAGGETGSLYRFEYDEQRKDRGVIGYSGDFTLQSGDLLFIAAENMGDADQGTEAISYTEMLPEYVAQASASYAASPQAIAEGFAGFSGKPNRVAAVVRVYGSPDSPRVPFSAPEEDVVTKTKADASANLLDTEARQGTGLSEGERVRLKNLLQSPLFGRIEAATTGGEQTKADEGSRILEALATPEFRSLPDVKLFDRAVSDYVKYWGGDDRRSKIKRLFRSWGGGYQIAGKREKDGVDAALAAMIDHLIALRASLSGSDMPGDVAEPPVAAAPVLEPPEEAGATAGERAAGEIRPIADASSGGENTASEDRWSRFRAWLREHVPVAEIYYDRDLHADVMQLARRDLRDGFADRPAVLERNYGPANPSAYYQLGQFAMLYWTPALQMTIREVRNGYSRQPPLAEPGQSGPSPAYKFGRSGRTLRERLKRE